MSPSASISPSVSPSISPSVSPSAAAGSVYLRVYTSGDGWVPISGRPYVEGDFHVCGSTTLGGSLAVSGATTINNQLNISGALTLEQGGRFENSAAGTITMYGHLTPTANATYGLGDFQAGRSFKWIDVSDGIYKDAGTRITWAASGTIMFSGILLTSSDNTRTIGTSTNRLGGLYVYSADISGTLAVSGDTTIGGDLTVCGSLTYATVYHSATSITLTVGTSTDTLADLTTMLDSASYDIGEVAGAPGIDLTINFTSNVTRINQIVVNAYYDGSNTHAVRIQLLNYVSDAWVTIHTLNDGRDYEQHYKKIIDDTPFISSSTASMRLYHTEAGNASHNLYVDYVGLTA